MRGMKVGLHDLGVNGNMVNFALFLLLLLHYSMIYNNWLKDVTEPHESIELVDLTM